MQKDFVLTLTGHDRIGIVESVTDVLVKQGGNILASRMARLGGEFAVLMLISLDEQHFPRFDADLQALRDEGYRSTFLPTENKPAQDRTSWQPYEIEVQGADHEGIIHMIAKHLAAQGITIENMETGLVSAPMSGTPFFTMQALILVPPQLGFQHWSTVLAEIGDRLDVQVQISAGKMP